MGEKRDFDDLPIKNCDFPVRELLLNIHLQAWLYCNCKENKHLVSANMAGKFVVFKIHEAKSQTPLEMFLET